MTLPEIKLLETNDAMVWAEEFARIGRENNWTLEDIDEGLMVSWFANAMCAQEFKDEKRIAELEKLMNSAGVTILGKEGENQKLRAALAAIRESGSKGEAIRIAIQALGEVEG